MSADRNVLYLPFHLSQPRSPSGTKKHLLISGIMKVKERAKIMPLQTFHNADVQLNCHSAWLFCSLFTSTTLLRSHTSNYLHAGVSTHGYGSFCLTTAVNSRVRDQNCSSESMTDDRYGKRFSMIFSTRGEGGMKIKMEKKRNSKKFLSTWGRAASRAGKAGSSHAAAYYQLFTGVSAFKASAHHQRNTWFHRQDRWKERMHSCSWGFHEISVTRFGRRLKGTVIHTTAAHFWGAATAGWWEIWWTQTWRGQIILLHLSAFLDGIFFYLGYPNKRDVFVLWHCFWASNDTQ